MQSPGFFAAARELLGEEVETAATRAEKTSARAAEVGRATLGGSPVGARWPMPGRQTRLAGLASGVIAVLLLAIGYGGWLWGAFGVSCVAAAIVAARVVRSKIVLRPDALCILGVFQTRVLPATSIKSVEVADITSAVAKSREGDLPSSQAVRLILANGRRVTVSAADVTPKVALAKAADPKLSDLRNVIEAWLAAVRPGATAGD